MMSGEYMINPLEPKAWGDGDRLESDSPEAFRKVTRFISAYIVFKGLFSERTRISQTPKSIR